MSIYNKIKTLVGQAGAKFISFKYLDITGVLHHIDIAAKNLYFSEGCFIVSDKRFRPIEDKYFLDPFRSLPTIFCLCEVVNDKDNKLYLRQDVFSKYDNYLRAECNIELKIEFSIIDHCNDSSVISLETTAEPNDRFANLRSEIVDILEKINVQTLYHKSSIDRVNIVAIKVNNILELADDFIIMRYIIANVAASYGKTAILCNNDKNIDVKFTFELQNIPGSQLIEHSWANIEACKAQIISLFNLKSYNEFSILNKIYNAIDIPDKIEISTKIYLFNPIIALIVFGLYAILGKDITYKDKALLNIIEQYLQGLEGNRAKLI